MMGEPKLSTTFVLFRRLLLIADNLNTVYKLALCCSHARIAYHHTPVTHFTSLVTSASSRLRAFIHYYSHLPAQGSAAWLAAKRDKSNIVIGGSELSTVLGNNPYNNLNELARQKLGISEFKGNVATCWGNIFERVLFEVSDLMLGGCITYETGSIPGLRDGPNGRLMTAYSPDRLGVVDVKALRYALDRQYYDTMLIGDYAFETANKLISKVAASDEGIEKKQLIILFEGKCPLRRVANGEVPDHYMPQVLIGMCTIPIVDMAVFVDGVFRRCSIRQWSINNMYYDKSLHCAWRRPYGPLPIRIGYVGIYDVSPTPAEKIIEKLMTLIAELDGFLEHVDIQDDISTRLLISLMIDITICHLDIKLMSGAELCTIIVAALVRNHIYCDELEVRECVWSTQLAHIEDLGVVSVDDLEIIFEKTVTQKKYQVYYPTLVSNTRTAPNMRDFVEAVDSYRIIGILPWKLMDIMQLPVAKNTRYMSDVHNSVKTAIDNIEKMRDSPNIPIAPIRNKPPPSRQKSTSMSEGYRRPSDEYDDMLFDIMSDIKETCKIKPQTPTTPARPSIKSGLGKDEMKSGFDDMMFEVMSAPLRQSKAPPPPSLPAKIIKAESLGVRAQSERSGEMMLAGVSSAEILTPGASLFDVMTAPTAKKSAPPKPNISPVKSIATSAQAMMKKSAAKKKIITKEARNNALLNAFADIKLT